MAAKRGLYANIHAKRKRIKAGSGEKMRKKGAKELPPLPILEGQQKPQKNVKRNDTQPQQ